MLHTRYLHTLFLNGFFLRRFSLDFCPLLVSLKSHKQACIHLSPASTSHENPTKSSLCNRRHETGNCLARQFPVKVDGLTSARFPTKCEVFLRNSSTCVYGGDADIDRAVVVSRLFSRLTDVLTCNRCDVRLTSFRLHPPPACLSLQTGVCKDARWRGVRCKKG